MNQQEAIRTEPMSTNGYITPRKARELAEKQRQANLNDWMLWQFRFGLNTEEIAKRNRMSEAECYNRIHAARERTIEWEA